VTGAASLSPAPTPAVGQRSADAAREAGFSEVTSAGGDVRDLLRALATRRLDKVAPLLYLAGEDRTTDLTAELAAHGIAAEMRAVYRAATAPFPPELTAALEAGDVEAVLHFSRRSAENYVAGARAVGIAEEALAVRHYCLSVQVAEPLEAAGAKHVAIAPRSQEAALIELLPLSPA
jgi:uroporphyrinogen-III synthase